MSDHDVVVIGSGHNALVAAALLAREGWDVLVLERNEAPGGFVRTEELTLPGFRHDTWASAHPLFVAGPAYRLLRDELERHGLRYVTAEHPTGISLPDGRGAVLAADPGAMQAEAERLGDREGWPALFDDFAGWAGPVFGLFEQDLTSPPARAALATVLAQPDGTPSPLAAALVGTASDFLDGRISSPELRALALAWLLHLGRRPREAGSAAWVPLTLAAVQGGMWIPVGGSGALVDALAALLADHGGTIRCGSAATRVLTDGRRATGVRTADGEEHRARHAVIASTAPDQLWLELLADDPLVPDVLRRQAARFRYGFGCVQVHLALSAAPTFAADERLDRSGQPILSPGPDGLDVSIAQAEAGLLPTEPTISLDLPTGPDPSRAPAGAAVARLQVLEVPTRPRGDAAGVIATPGGGWTPDLRERFADRVMAIAERHLPGIGELVLARHVVGPAEIAAYNPNSGPGDPYGGRHDLAQSYTLRPVPAASSHATPVPGLWQLGAATWPGHGVNGGSGWIVAQRLLAALADRGAGDVAWQPPVQGRPRIPTS